jgi:hypothetical protein
MTMQDYEKLGVFYLGRDFDLGAGKLKDNLVLYDSRDLVTHAVVVGMTGSGKTGLCIDLIEEAAIDSVPSILIDPKGDLANLLLTFPSLKGEDFLPWINADDATRKGLSPADFAKQQAALWQKGLGDWAQDGARIQRLRDTAELVVYTPGSSAGVPVSILNSFAVPPAEIMEDGELLQERITTTVTSLLGLLNINADPLQSREHILLSTIIGQIWKQGKDMDLADLITQIQNPPMSKIGVLDVESFYPSKDRFSLVMALNNLLASPGFSAWLEGMPLDIGQILHTGAGRPRVSIFSIAHLSDPERMFFVSLLLNQVLGWMRTQPGTTSLRALLYMDEIFGYFPPVANPPSKQPLLTLLKQARAFGVGIVLATQNPVDLDYKGLANTGTWFIGRLQTERDKARVMEGLEGAAASSGGGFDGKKMEQLLAGLGNRVFLMNNTHDDQPVIFQTRWSLSYLRGPLTRSQIKTLMDPYKASNLAETAVSAAAGGSAASGRKAAPQTAGSSGGQPSLPPDVTQFFIPARGGGGLVYQPMALGAARVRFNDPKTKVDTSTDIVVITPIVDEEVPVDWARSEDAGMAVNDLEKKPEDGARFADIPGLAARAKNIASWNRDFVAWAFSEQKVDLLRSPSSGMVSQPGEVERDFRVRLQQSSREQRDQVSDALRKKYAVKIAALEEKVRKAQQVVDREAAQAKNAQVKSALSVGATLLGAFVGNKKLSASTVSRAATAFGGVGRSIEQQGDVNRAKETVAAYNQQLANLNTEFNNELASLESKIDPMTETLDTVSVRPKKSDITVQLISLVWAPYREGSGEKMDPAW